MTPSPRSRLFGRRPIQTAVFLILVVVSRAIVVPAWNRPVHADDTPGDRLSDDEGAKPERAARLVAMRVLAGQFEMTRPDGDRAEHLELRADPLFRYSDQPRGFLDATPWAWGPAGRNAAVGRPAVVAKVEIAVNGKTPYWQFCVASLADQPVNVDFRNARKLTTKKAWFEMRPIPDAPAPADRPALRQRQMKDLVGRFAATIHARHLDTKELVKQEMRLLPRPIHRYADEKAGVRDGMIFGLTTNGTNPDLLIVIELKDEKGTEPIWSYGIVKMTYSEVHLRLDKPEVWVSPVSEPLETWTYFQAAREE